MWVIDMSLLIVDLKNAIKLISYSFKEALV